MTKFTITSSKIKFIITLLLATTLFGCSFHTENMVSEKAEYSHPINKSVVVGVKNETSAAVAFYSATVDVKKFSKAITISLNESKLFTDATAYNEMNKEEKPYKVNVGITYAASAPGFSMTGFVNANWSILNTKTDKILWSKFIKGQGHATMSDTLVGAKRQIMAIERAAKDNITKALLAIDKANLKLK